MAKLIADNEGNLHLRGAVGHALCGEEANTAQVSDGTLECAACAKIALNAVELVTKAEKREWRKL